MPWVSVPIFNGTTEEALRLVDCIGHHCECLSLKRRCPAHELMLNQHALDHLMFERWLYLKKGEPVCRSRRSGRTR